MNRAIIGVSLQISLKTSGGQRVINYNWHQHSPKQNDQLEKMMVNNVQSRKQIIYKQ